MMFGLIATQSAIAREEEATEVADQVTGTVDEVEQEAAGFDDWGLLGLLGLLGLAGLLKKSDNDVRTVERTTNPVERPIVDRDDDITVRDRTTNDRL